MSNDRGDAAETLLQVLQKQATGYGSECAFRYLRENGNHTAVTFGDLDKNARRIAVELRRHARHGDRALLLFPPGLEFISAFFGCLYAGVVAVPSTYPGSKRGMHRISSIAEDCSARIVLTLARSLTTIDLDRVSGKRQSLKWIATDSISDDVGADCVCANVKSDTLAFLQYTSGSTSKPKGVMVSHGNAVCNLEMIRTGFRMAFRSPHEPHELVVSWLPAYHDMGLIGGILESLYVGSCTVLMSPTSFLQRPERWLRAISDHRATISGAPNFAYDLCVRRAREKRLDELDLSSWRVAFCGAEPVHAETLRRFSKTFSRFGFREKAFYPCYGLAEATLLAAGGQGPSPCKVLRVRRSEVAKHRVIEANGDANNNVATFVGCGAGLLAQDIVIADPQDMTRRGAGQVGEIWIKGPNVAQGYWEKPAATKRTFTARLTDTGEEPFLRTGDLGFMHDGDLYITGRAKDVIIVRGRNHYPQDLELTVENSHQALLPSGGAAFAAERGDDSQLVIVHEIDRAYRNADFQALARTVRRAVVTHHELDPHAIIFIRQASLPRTTSGKVQRSLCRQRYFNDELKVVAKWFKPDQAAKRPGDSQSDAASLQADDNGTVRLDDAGKAVGKHSRIDRLADRIEETLFQWLREQGIPPGEIDRDKVFADYGVDSLAAVQLSGRLEDRLDIRITPVIAWQFPTPALLARYLASEAGGIGFDQGRRSDATEHETDGELAGLVAEIEALSEGDVGNLLGQEGKTIGKEAG